MKGERGQSAGEAGQEVAGEPFPRRRRRRRGRSGHYSIGPTRPNPSSPAIPAAEDMERVFRVLRFLRASRTAWLARAALVAAVLGAACGRSEPDAGSGRAPIAPTRPVVAELRVVSLSPAISATLRDLGVADRIVGRTPYCESVPTEVPVVGSLLDLDYERLLSVRPSLVLVQPPAAGMDSELERLARREGWRLERFQLERLEDVAAMLGSMGDLVAVGRPPAARKAVERRAELELLVARRGAEDAPAVAILIGGDPWLAAGSGTFLGQVVEGIGRRNAIGARGYVELGREDLAVLAADAIVMVRSVEPSEAERERLLGPLRSAAPTTKLAILAHPDAMLPASGLADVALRLNEVLNELALPGTEVLR